MASLPPSLASTVFHSRFQTICAELASKLVNEFGSPVYLMDLEGLQSRFDEFQRVTKSYVDDRVVAISYKTNPTSALLQGMHDTGAYAEVISNTEYDLALSLGVPPKKIVFNGPAKKDADLRQAIAGNGQINCDHFGEVRRVEALAASDNVVAKIGIRLSLPTRSTFSRFGFAANYPLDESPAFDVAKYIHRSPHLALGGIHSQGGTNVSDMEVFRRQGRGMAAFAQVLRERLGHELEWINVGGGLAGIAPEMGASIQSPHLPDIDEYCQALLPPILDFCEAYHCRPTIFFEPGRTLFDPAGALLTTILGSRPAVDGQAESLICDGGITLLSLASEFEIPVHVCEKRSGERCLDIFGPSCMQRDQIARRRRLPAVQVGDTLVFYGVGGYSLALASSFIHSLPGVVGWFPDGSFSWLRLPESHEHTQMLQVLPTSNDETSDRLRRIHE